MKFILATHNQKKCREMQRILSPIGVEVFTGDMLGIDLEDVEETGTTFEQNAYIKASAASKQSGLAAIADDSGLVVDALDGAPGVYSARYAGEHGNDGANNKKLLSQMKDVPDSLRGARFVCAVCVYFPDGRYFVVKGKCEGKIGYEERGEGGFGYDPLFMTGEKSFAQLTDDEKDRLSHRGKALRLMAKELVKYINC